jgi:hypothetical protein
MSKEPIVNLPSLYVDNGKLSWASNTTLTVAAIACRDSTNVYDLTTTSTLTINAAVVGVNGIDTGAFAASKCYAVFIIGDSAGFNTPKALISLSATAPVMPTGYDILRRIGWAFSDGSTHFVVIYQSGTGKRRVYTFDEPISAISSGTSATFLAVDLSNQVPAVDNLVLTIQAAFTPNAANDAAYIRAGGSSATNGCVLSGPVAAKVASGQITTVAKLVTSAPKIEYKVTASGNLDAKLVSFVDEL